MIVVVIGVTGSGKSTIGSMLARAVGCEFLEGDTLHSPGNIEKMSRGIPLNDDDRGPWLSAIHARIADANRRGVNLVVACSALKQKYRDVLERGVAISWVYLQGSKELLRRRLQKRPAHFMKASMLDSQFEALEEPSNAIVIDVASPPDIIVEGIMWQLSLGVDVRVLADVGVLSAAAAAAAVEIINRAVATRGRCSLALSGGDTPRGLYRLLGSQHRDRIPWQRVHVFWGDDRYVPGDHPESNYRLARETLLDHVPCAAGNIHAMPTHFSSAADAAATYDELLKEHFGGGNGPTFDLNILGIGDDAHTASVFPGSPAVDEAERWVLDVQTPATPPTRLTLSLPALSYSTNIHVLVAGAAKARALRHALAADSDPHLYPASGIRRGRGVVWWVDHAAARDIAPPLGTR
ncbi:MAG: 6-phosphogluconolactonase [Vicinamibacterales bacterium]